MYSPVDDRFAPGQYLDLPEDQQLRRPSFESFPAGMRIDPAGLDKVPGDPIQCDLKYETSFPNRHPRVRIYDIVKTGANRALMVAATAAGSSPLRTPDRYAVAAPGLAMAGPEMVVVRSRTDLTAAAGVSSAAMTWTHGEQAAAQQAGQLQVVALGGA